MKTLESLFSHIGNWWDKKTTPPEIMMQEKVARERYMQLHEAELDRLKHLAAAEHHRGLAAGAENTIRRIKLEVL